MLRSRPLARRNPLLLEDTRVDLFAAKERSTAPVEVTGVDRDRGNSDSVKEERGAGVGWKSQARKGGWGLVAGSLERILPEDFPASKVGKPQAGFSPTRERRGPHNTSLRGG